MSALSERLTAARKAAGVSQLDAGKHIGISRPTYIAIEKGEREVRPAELVALAALFKTQVSRLVRQDTAPPMIAPHLRGEIPQAAQEVGVSEAIDKLAEFVDDYQFLLEKNNARLMPVMAPPLIDRASRELDALPARVAQYERSRLGFGEREPIGDLRKTLDEVGVHVFVDAMHSRLAGLYSYVPGFGYCILVNRLHPRERMRWTIAHEYGHFVYDRDKPGVDYLNAGGRKPFSERFADAFAANFLMPAEGVRRQFEDAKARSGDVNVGDVCRIADFYGVSMNAMTLRMEGLKLIRSGTWEFLKESGVRVSDLKRDAGISEPDQKPVIDTFPERYLLLAIQAWNNEEITTSQFAKLIRRSPLQARDLADRRSRIDEEGLLQVKLNASVLDRNNAPA
ncbi:XRE family transcriptional regulator [Luteimonas fraxinea]|uniref:XRE family transcriptional regulator n=1 Tax=Luteimonas fraxinea TaxID=2901869 RepID=A0ABS8UEX9_9GAMM|nr:XRE family transcriptional regulator [Luteimonas fraxinea]MCD9098063.1 XRE family transcriptional regulator [Luteimonas fraxinea]UHH09212.1 XRE family transcriptional regulator [Luteimonas fraxinea]